MNNIQLYNSSIQPLKGLREPRTVVVSYRALSPYGEPQPVPTKALSNRITVPTTPPPFRHTPYRFWPQEATPVWRNLPLHPRIDDSFTFSAKERDPETGYSYFGSRYYSSDLSIWLSVDPMSDKYASLSPYVYCADNPVKLVDPNGEEIGDVDEASRKKIEALTTKGSADYSRAFTRKYNQLAKSKTVYNFKEASQDEITAQRRGGVFHNDDGSVDIIHSEGGVRTSTEGGFSSKYATLFEETFHASEFDKGRLNLNAPTCFDEAKAWKFAVKAPGTSFWDELNNAFTFAGVVDKLSVSQLSYLFHRGGKPQVDEYGRGEHIMGAEKGLYNHLPIK